MIPNLCQLLTKNTLKSSASVGPVFMDVFMTYRVFFHILHTDHLLVAVLSAAVIAVMSLAYFDT